MRLTTIDLSKVSRTLTASITAFALSIIITNSVTAADITTNYNDSCSACHNSGALNAIKKGDTVKWQQLIQRKGMPALVKSVKNGMIQMPAGGLCDNCSDDDYRQLIEYMSK